MPKPKDETGDAIGSPESKAHGLMPSVVGSPSLRSRANSDLTEASMQLSPLKDQRYERSNTVLVEAKEGGSLGCWYTGDNPDDTSAMEIGVSWASTIPAFTVYLASLERTNKTCKNLAAQIIQTARKFDVVLTADLPENKTHCFVPQLKTELTDDQLESLQSELMDHIWELDSISLKTEPKLQKGMNVVANTVQKNTASVVRLNQDLSDTLTMAWETVEAFKCDLISTKNELDKTKDLLRKALAENVVIKAKYEEAMARIEELSGMCEMHEALYSQHPAVKEDIANIENDEDH